MAQPVDVAHAERLVQRLVPARAVRARRLGRIRQAVQTHEYENPLKLSIALDRLLERRL